MDNSTIYINKNLKGQFYRKTNDCCTYSINIFIIHFGKVSVFLLNIIQIYSVH